MKDTTQTPLPVLEEIRKEIQATDKEIAVLFEKRMHLSEGIIRNKMAQGLPILDPEREKQLLDNNLHFIDDPVLKEYYVLFQKHVTDLSKAYQSRLMQGMKVAYCGLPGAFAQIAVGHLFPDAEQLPFPDFESAYKACENGQADVAVLPVENSYSGEVGSVIDLVFEGSLYINMMLELGVTQNLLGVKGASKEDIKTVLSHPQALSQCADFIHAMGYGVQEYENTALAAKYVADRADKTLAAIGSLENARRYGLEVLESNINNAATNTTRFAALSRVRNEPAKDAAGEYFILVFTVKNEAGALAKVLNIIRAHGFNMTNLRSRPMKKGLWNHFFYAELEGSAHSGSGRELLTQLNTVCSQLKLVGTYKRM